MQQPLFTGTCTALVTPFLGNAVNYPMLEVLLRRQISAGIPAVVICGTTGEAPTLSDREKEEMFRFSKEVVGESMQIFAGTGGNCTSHAVELSLCAQEAGADGLLLVSPYYNKATEDGLFSHYLTIAHAVKLPIILYNVPSRTGQDMSVSVYQRLAHVPNIVGVKEASADIEKVAQIKATCPKDFCVWSGNDTMAVPTVSLGGQGVISVVSNVIPTQMQAMVNAALDGDLDTAADMHAKLFLAMKSLFCQVNPIPVKYAMKCIGYDCGDCRLPLTTLSKEYMQKLDAYFA